MSKRSWARNALAVVVAAALASTVAACSSSKASSGSNSSAGATGSLTHITIDSIPIVDSAALYLGVQRGIFTKAGFDVTLTNDPQGGAGTVPSIISGKSQFGVAAASDVIQARSKGFPVSIVAGLDAGPTEESQDQSWITSLASSGLTTMKELVGKTIAVSTLGGLQQIEVQEAFVNAGLPADSAKFVSVNFPQEPAALTNKQVDASALVEPFVTQIQQQTKVNLIAGEDFATGPSAPAAVLMVTESYYAKNMALVARFQTAVQHALAFAAANTAAVRASLPGFAGLPADLAAKVRLPSFPTQINMAAVKRLQDDMVTFKIIDKAADLNSLVISAK